MAKKKYPLPEKQKKTKDKSTKKPLNSEQDFLLCEEPMTYIAPKNDLVTLEDAALLTGKTTHNIRDYIQRGRIAKLNSEGKSIQRADIGELRIFLPNLDGLLKAHYRKYDLGL